MITQLILNVMGRTIIGIVSLIPPLSADITARIGSTISAMGSVAQGVAKFGVILPWGTLWSAAQLFMAFWLAAAVIYLVRFVVSLVSGGGGAQG